MSLQVWLPLNGNLNNQGLKNIQAVGNGITLDNNGKIGQCYSFDGTDDYITLNNITCSGWAEFSLTCWCYPTADFSSLFLIRGSSAHRIRIADNGITFRDSNNSTSRIIGFGETIPQNQWVHIACIYNRGEISMYINGILTNHNTNYYHSNSILLSDHNEVRIARSQSTSGNSYYTGKINDFRIYDHALSAKEVEEIAKELVLHYKLSQYNLINKETLTPNNYINSNGTLNSTNNWYVTDYIPVTPGKTYQTIKLSTGGSGTYIGIYNKSKIKTRTILMVANENNNFSIENNEAYVRLSIRSINNELKDAFFYEVDENIIDCSGYGNNGIPTNITTSSSSPRYSCSSNFNGSNSYIAAGRGAMVRDAISVCCWAYMTNWANYTARLLSCTEDGGWNFAPSSEKLNFAMGTGVSSNTYKNAVSTRTLASLSSGWHYFVGTYDGFSTKIYIDGNLEGTNAAYTTKTPIYYYSGNGIFIGAEAGATMTTPAATANTKFNGNISDVRIYATALSIDQIKELYNTSVTIDNEGNIYTREEIENNNDLNINKNGQFHNNQIIDSDDISTASISKTKIVSANTFYEY